MIRRGVLVSLLVAALGGGIPPRAAGIDAASYRAATASGAIGGVAGRIYEERKRPDTPDLPLTGAAVFVLPSSADVARQLEEIKRMARNSSDGYRAAAPSILAVRRAYEKKLWDSGAGDLVKSTTVDANGRFSVPDLPAGDWLLVATYSVKVDKPSAAGVTKQRGVYTPRTHLTGFQRVTFWLREVTVTGGRLENLELTDRGAWFSGVVEERAPD
ncbi:MAG: hypothetical protein ACRELZ_19930, partial [Candidatus Rokuibacteriota bacterium]